MIHLTGSCVSTRADPAQYPAFCQVPACSENSRNRQLLTRCMAYQCRPFDQTSLSPTPIAQRWTVCVCRTQTWHQPRQTQIDEQHILCFGACFRDDPWAVVARGPQVSGDVFSCAVYKML